MSTDYYVEEKPPCPCCHRQYEWRHIGRYSAKWAFDLTLYPREGINSLDDWRKHLEGKTVFSERGPLSAEEMIDFIINGYESWGDKVSHANGAHPGFHAIGGEKYDYFVYG